MNVLGTCYWRDNNTNTHFSARHLQKALLNFSKKWLYTLDQTPFVPKSNRVLVSVTISIFQWHLTWTSSSSGIFRKSSFFDATQPIFPKNITTDNCSQLGVLGPFLFSRIHMRVVYGCINSRRKRVIHDSEHTQPTPTLPHETHTTHSTHTQTTRSTPASLDS